jgi:hypothetical protein
MQVKMILFTNVFFSWSLCFLKCFHRWYSPSSLIFPVCWHNRHHSSWPFLECRSSKLYFKILWKYDDWFHHFLENGRFYRENTCKCSPLVTKWQIILHFHCCFNKVLLTVSCPIFPSILIAKNLLTGSLKNRSIDNLETQKKSISMKNSQFFDYLLYAKSK